MEAARLRHMARSTAGTAAAAIAAPVGLLTGFFHLLQREQRTSGAAPPAQPSASGFEQPFQRCESRDWLHVDSAGRVKYVAVDKHALVMALGVPYRDLRMLDPAVPIPYPSALFIREKALVVNLEAVRMLICKDQLYVLGVPHCEAHSSPDRDSPFVRELVLRIQSGSSGAHASGDRGGCQLPLDWRLPYELRALECALATVTRLLSRECAELEGCVSAPLERLSDRVNRADLETVRNVKTSLAKLMVRVRKVRTELERLLEDDGDMSNMYLGRREEQAEAEAAAEAALCRMASFSSTALGHSAARAFARSASGLTRESLRTSVGAEPPIQEGEAEGSEAAEAQGEPAEDAQPADGGAAGCARDDASLLRRLAQLERQTSRMSLGLGAAPHPVEECEALLESYLLQADFLLSGLSQLKERIEDTEDLIIIELDSKRNELVSLDMVVTMGTSAMTFMTVVTGVFGMNATVGAVLGSFGAFWGVALITGLVSTIIFAALVAYAWFRGLIFLSAISVQPHAPHWEVPCGAGPQSNELPPDKLR